MNCSSGNDWQSDLRKRIEDQARLQNIKQEFNSMYHMPDRK